ESLARRRSRHHRHRTAQRPKVRSYRLVLHEGHDVMVRLWQPCRPVSEARVWRARNPEVPGQGFERHWITLDREDPVPARFLKTETQAPASCEEIDTGKS